MGQQQEEEEELSWGRIETDHNTEERELSRVQQENEGKNLLKT
jgi:hypothetical protein